jgi:outer membrane lipopolysaccharide assembly protein LptE/RlpB
MRTTHIIFSLIILVSIAGCGYRMSARYHSLPDHITTIAVPSFENRTMQFDLSAQLTQAVKREFMERSSCRITAEEDSADAVLHGAITSYSVTPIAIKRQNVGTSFLVTITVQVDFKDRRKDAVIYSNSAFVLREEYILSDRNVDFYVEEGPAIDRLTRSFADSLVSTILEAF